MSKPATMEKEFSSEKGNGLRILVAVKDAPVAVAWYHTAPGATLRSSLVSPPIMAGRVPKNSVLLQRAWKYFCHDPDAFIARAVQAGAYAEFDNIRITSALGYS